VPAKNPWVYGLKIGLTVDATWEVYQEAWMDDRDITLEEPELATLGMISAAPLWGVYAVIGAGFVASYAIGGQAGAEKYTDYIFSPEQWAPTVRDQITSPVIHYIKDELWQKQLVEPIGAWWQDDIVDPITESWIWNL